MTAATDFEARLATITAVDQQKNELVQDLIARVKLLDQNLSQAERQLERERDISDMYQKRNRSRDLELKSVKQSLAQMSYVSVLVDGDCMPFVDDLLQQGEAGGRQAARQLKTSVIEHLRDNHTEVPVNLKITIRVFANLTGLAKAYRDAKVLQSSADLGNFVNGFNKEDALCDFVNAGDGKECADEKIKALFQLNMENVQCVHVVFAGSADNGYARLLGPHVDSTRVSLLEGPPFAKELAELARRFCTFRSSAVFRQTKLLRYQVSSDLTPPRTPAIEKTATSNYAAIVSAPKFNTPNHQVHGQKNLSANSSRLSTTKIPRNAAGHRVDPPQTSTNAEIKATKAAKACNEYHLLCLCSRGKSCSFKHGTRMTGKQLEALRCVARLSACSNGLFCDDGKCIYGHRCGRVPCRKGAACLFPVEMHGVDGRVVG